MIFIPYGLCLLAVLAGVSYVLLGLWMAVRRGERCRCPGPERLIVPGYRSPLRWFLTRRCGYDLRGHEFNEHNEARCPECGTTVGRHRLCRDSMRVRPLATGLLLTFIGLLGLNSGWFTWSDMAKQTPTSALIVVQEVLDAQVPREIRSELQDRIRNTVLNTWQTDESVSLLVRDMREDETWGNAASARQLLTMLGVDALAGLEAALHSPDYQQRQLAAEVLRKHGLYAPSEQMIAVCVEGLMDDSLGNYNASNGTVYLIDHIQRAEAAVIAGLDSNDVQQRLLCATVLGCARRTDHVDRAMPVLLEHLMDNDFTEDAVVARQAIEGFGEWARPYLQKALESPDVQLRTKAQRIPDGLAAPPESEIDGAIEPLPPIHPRGIFLLSFPNTAAEHREDGEDGRP